jgi:hypothetical protein
MLVKRLVAALVAVALVGGALWLRSKRDDTAAGDDPATTTTPGPAQSIICVPELEAACRAAAADEGLTVTVEPAGDTVDRLAAAENPGPVLWATLASFPDLVDDLRGRAGRAPLFTAGTEAMASSKLVLVGRTPQMDVLAAHCGGDLTWRCLGDVAGRPWTDIGGQAAWRDVKPAHEAADTSGTGLLTFANAVVSWFGRTDIGTVDLADEAFQDWVRRLERSIPSFGGPQGTPFDQLLLLPSPNVVGTTEAEVEAKAGARRGELTVTYPAPMAQADAVLASGAGTPVPDDLAATIGGALQAGAWDPPSAAPPGGLPAPPVLQALRQLWTSVVR